MEHIYNAYTKQIQGETWYFVKKIMVLPELVGIADMVVGFGMHTDFEKACHIAGVEGAAQRMQIKNDLEQILQPIQSGSTVRFQSKSAPAVSDPVTHWLADQALVVLN